MNSLVLCCSSHIQKASFHNNIYYKENKNIPEHHKNSIQNSIYIKTRVNGAIRKMYTVTTLYINNNYNIE